MNAIKRIILNCLVGVTLLCLPLLAVQPVSALFGGSKEAACQGVNLDNTGCGDSAAASNSVNNVLTNGINIFSIVVGVIAVIMIILGGLKFVLAGGESAQVAAARNTILYAIIGIVVASLAQFILRFILNKI